MDWTEPILVEHEVYAGPKRRRVWARIGFPRKIADDEWACSFQVRGTQDKRRWLEDGKISRALSTDGLGALWNACYPVRYLFDRLKDVQPSEAPHEFVFPVFLPTSDTRHGIDFYRELAHTLSAEIKKFGIERPEAAPPTEKLTQSTWTAPVLQDESLSFGPQKHRIRVRIGPPYFLGGDNTWACSFQLEGLQDSPIQRVRGDNGLMALAGATKVIRESFDELEAQSTGTYYELLFPAYLPTGHGLALHQRLRRLLDSERAREQRNQSRRRRREQRRAAQEHEAEAKAKDAN